MIQVLQEMIRIDHSSDTPVYLQITNAFIHHIRLGRLRKGLKLPGSREVAAMLDINRMTMVAAYDELQAQGWIEMLPRKGTFVKKDLPVLTPRRIDKEQTSFSMPEKTIFSFRKRNLKVIFFIHFDHFCFLTTFTFFHHFFRDNWNNKILVDVFMKELCVFIAKCQIPAISILSYLETRSIQIC